MAAVIAALEAMPALRCVRACGNGTPKDREALCSLFMTASLKHVTDLLYGARRWLGLTERPLEAIVCGRSDVAGLLLQACCCRIRLG